MLRPAFLLGAALALFALAARAEDRPCFGADFDDGATLAIGKIRAGAPHVNFLRNPDKKNPGCPSAAAECRDKAFLVPGDLVVIGRKLGDFICADFLTAKNSRSGWLPADAIETAPVITNAADWAGDWQRVEAEIKIKAGAGGLTADGAATFGALDPERVKRGAVNMGEFSGALALKDGQATYVDKDADPKLPDSGCRIRMARAGDDLFVQDNRQCGGMNVSFTGLYRR